MLSSIQMSWVYSEQGLSCMAFYKKACGCSKHHVRKMQASHSLLTNKTRPLKMLSFKRQCWKKSWFYRLQGQPLCYQERKSDLSKKPVSNTNFLLCHQSIVTEFICKKKILWNTETHYSKGSQLSALKSATFLHHFTGWPSEVFLFSFLVPIKHFVICCIMICHLTI